MFDPNNNMRRETWIALKSECITNTPNSLVVSNSLKFALLFPPDLVVSSRSCCFLQINLSFFSFSPDEVSKLQSHLSLLREEYVKLQNRFADLDRRYQVAVAGSGEGNKEESFVTRLLRIIADLHDKEQYRYSYSLSMPPFDIWNKS